MAKFYGPIGYAVSIETSPGVWDDSIIERNYAGDILEMSNRLSEKSDSVNDDLTLNHRISVLIDPYAYENFSSIKYVEVMGTKWKVSNVSVQYPRLILSTGGVYNG